MFKLKCNFVDSRENFEKSVTKNYYYTNMYDLVESVNRIINEEFKIEHIGELNRYGEFKMRINNFTINSHITLEMKIFKIKVDQYISIEK